MRHVVPDICCQSGAIGFLASHGFDFNKCLKHGIGYMPASLRDRRLAQVWISLLHPPKNIFIAVPCMPFLGKQLKALYLACMGTAYFVCLQVISSIKLSTGS